MYEGQQGYANWSLRLLAGKVVEFADKPRNGEADAKRKFQPIPPPFSARMDGFARVCMLLRSLERSDLCPYK